MTEQMYLNIILMSFYIMCLFYLLIYVLVMCNMYSAESSVKCMLNLDIKQFYISFISENKYRIRSLKKLIL